MRRWCSLTGRPQHRLPPDIRSAVDNVFLLPRRWGDGDKKLLREYYRWDEEWCSDEKWAKLLDECARRELCLVFNTQPEGSVRGMSDYVSVIEA
jgi:hypothetical protein